VRVNRRQLLQALGLGALSGAGIHGGAARADGVDPPPRIVFFVQPHGHVTKNWTMPVAAPADVYADRPLAGLAPADFSEVLRPLHPFRQKLLAIEGLSHTSVLADIAEVQKHGGDLNNHSISVAGLLTGARAMQRSGAPCTGGARSLDQEIAARTSGPGRFGSRVYGFDYVPNSTVAPFSFLGPGQAAPMVSDPATAFEDLLGFAPRAVSDPMTRDDRIRLARTSVLDAAAREYDAMLPRLGADGRRRLEQHRDLVRELETGLLVQRSCDGKVDRGGHAVSQLVRLVRLAFACDLTRVATVVAPVPQCPEIGYPAEGTVHGYAHQSIEGNTSCGETFNPTAERLMTDLGVWYANHLALLLAELDAVPEGSGTMLDHTVVVWLTELATPTHQHHDVCTVLAGGGHGYFDTGRYVRYPRTEASPLVGQPRTGPALNRLFVSLLQAMRQPDTSFGMHGALAADGSVLSFEGPLSELTRRA